MALEQNEGVGPQAHLFLPLRLFPSDLFKRKNRKTEKQWVGGQGSWGVLEQDRVKDFPLLVNKVP